MQITTSRPVQKILMAFLPTKHIRRSIDSNRCWIDNILIECSWRHVVYEEVYLRAYEDILKPRVLLGLHFEYCGNVRQLQALDLRTTDHV